MQTIELNAESRVGVGKERAKKLRRSGKVPAILYGPNREPLPLAVPERELVERITALEGAHLIRFRAELEELKDCVALVKQAQFHPVTGRPLHVDFYQVDLAKKIRVRVPLHFTGRAQGVVLGGILQPLQREIEVECLPLQIPEFIEVNVSGLGVHDSIHISEVVLPEAVAAVYHEDIPLVTVLPPVVEKPTTVTTEVTGEVVVAEK